MAPERRGTFAGLVEKIPYLQDLGVTAVELLPVLQFDAQDAPPARLNFWGYCPVSFFAPHLDYSSQRHPLAAIDEFRDMVKAFHRAGIEVILDVVFNHTGEGDHLGPTLCFRGFDNAMYYMLKHDRSRYADFSGSGNTLNANHSVVRRLILDCLHFWVDATCTWTASASTWRPSCPATSGDGPWRPAGLVGHRLRSRARRHQAHRRGLGRGRAVPGGLVHRRPLDGVERKVPR